MTKLGVVNWFKESKELAPHVPETRMLTKTDFLKLIAKYGDVIVKPDVGNRGRGVFKVSSKGKRKYEIHTEDQIKTIIGKDATYAYLEENIGSEVYIVQQRIPLTQIDGRIIEFRVIVQRRTLAHPWTVTGKVVKVAGKGYIVTNNERSNGTVLPVDDAIEKSSLKNVSKSKLLSEMDRIVLQATEIYTAYYLNRLERILGFDMGVDDNGNIWIIEVNLTPMLDHFSKLKDKALYYRILNTLFN